MMLNSNSNSAGRAPKRSRRVFTPPKRSGTPRKVDRGLWWILFVALIAALATGIQTMTTYDLDDSQSVVAMPHARHAQVKPATDAGTSGAITVNAGS
jgi:hypothetical protein